MRRTAAGLVLLIAATAAAQSRKWATFTSGANGYTVKFPAAPKSDTKPLALAAGVIQMDTDRYEAHDLVLAVTVATYPETFKDVAAKTLLDGVKTGLKGSDGEVRADDEMKLDAGGTTVTGREFRVEAGRNVVRCRAFLVGNKLYQVMATGSKDAVGGKTAEQFFGSFELLPAK